MEKYLVPLSPSPETPQPLRRHRRWYQNAPELDGRLHRDHRRAASRLLLDSYAEVRAFPHSYHIGSDCCPTYLARTINSAIGGSQITPKREGVSSLEFDAKGIYLASVTKSGCLTIHDFETLYCSIYGPSSSGNLIVWHDKKHVVVCGTSVESMLPLLEQIIQNSIREQSTFKYGLYEDENKQVFHISTALHLDVVRWNPENQDEVACISRQSNKILLFDIGYISSEPVEVLEKRRSKSSGFCGGVYNGLSDIKFTLVGKSRLLASNMEGSIHIWDRRLSNLPCLELTNNSKVQVNSIQLDVEERIVFGASRNGIVYAWDLRGGRTSFAFQSHNQVYYPLLTSVKISTMLEKITYLKAQSNILPKEIHSISIDPSCPYQLSFHIDDGWSGVLNTSLLEVTHIHCPPPAWLDGTDMSPSFSDLRKPSWLPAFSIYAVPSSSQIGIHLLDFYPDVASSCHVDFCEDSNRSSKVPRQNRFIPLTESVLACTTHPLNGTIVAGSKKSSLLVISQSTNTDET